MTTPLATQSGSGPGGGGTHKLSSWNPFDQAPRGAAVDASKTASSAPDREPPGSYYTSVAPKIGVPAGGGALKPIEEKFQVNPVTGTCSLAIPFALPPGRNDLTPSVTLAYDSGSGNGAFGLGWSLSSASISRKTAKGIPRYNDSAEEDVFVLSGMEDLVPVTRDGSGAISEVARGEWSVRQYKPRTEGAFTRIERWFKPGRPGETHWRTISRSNVTTLLGNRPDCKIMDRKTGRVFSWLISEIFDSRGNAAKYEYKPEDSVGVNLHCAHEQHRTQESRAANRHIKSIKYGNIRPCRDRDWNQVAVPQDGWMFEVVFDYGDHQGQSLTAQPNAPWRARRDPFSAYTAGFELRSYRLCRRILLFHHLENELGVEDFPVRSMELSYRELETVSVLSQITQSGHLGDIKQSLPPIEFDYSTVNLGTAVVKAAPASSLSNLPAGLSGPIQWVDLDGTGKSNALLRGNNSWLQMSNLSTYRADYQNPLSGVADVGFGPAMPLASIPNSTEASQTVLLDLDGSGRIDAVRRELGEQGFYQRTDEGGWTEFRRFSSFPTVDTKSENCRYLDLSGDGLADVVIAEGNNFLWYPSLGTEGYGQGVRAYTGASEEEGPRLLFTDGFETIYLADCTGDGLVDLVRVRNGDICYWPNMGYGKFGAKVTMDNAPVLDPWYGQTRIELADIDGSGTADLLYFPALGGLKVYMNQAGNGWSSAVHVEFPPWDSLADIRALDLFGTGTASIVWSSAAPGSKKTLTLRYLDFAHGIKPHLLTLYKNGCSETRLNYASSTMFSQDDEASGRPWPTRLPFPVQCLTRVENYDYVSRTYSRTSHSYHDGYFDGSEREFRGFGMVETISSENFLLERTASTFPTTEEVKLGLASLPARQVAWYHVGCYESAEKINSAHQRHFYKQSTTIGSAASTLSLAKPLLYPANVNATETKQAYRALKGTLLHQETFLLDGSARECVPITTTDSSSSVRMLQGAVGRHPGVFLIVPQESVTCQIERDDADPRVGHSLTLETDEFGNVKKSVSISYGRLGNIEQTPGFTAEDWAAQSTTVMTYTENDFTNSVSGVDTFLTPLLFESRVFEIKGLSSASPLFRHDELSMAIPLLETKTYTDTGGCSGKRMISRSQTRFRADDLFDMLSPGVLQPLAIPGETYTLAMTADVAQKGFRNDASSHSLLPDASIIGDATANGGGYVDLEDDGSFWVPSGQQRFSTDEQATPAQELEAARSSFFQPCAFIDPFGFRELVYLDDYQVFPIKHVDALGNTTAVVMDYRVLQPRLVTDINGNQTALAFDALGNTCGTATMGKPTSPLGDTVEGFQSCLDRTALQALLQDPLQHVEAHLGNCTTVSFSDFASLSSDGNWRPAVNITVAREVSVSSSGGQLGLHRLNISLSYSDGRGRGLQQRSLADVVSGPQQWVVSSHAVLNGAGAVVRQFDSFFASSHQFGWPSSEVVFSTSFYDSVGRLAAMVLPNHTWTKNIYGAWFQKSFDPGDTILIDNPADDSDVGRYFGCLDGKDRDSIFHPTWYSTMAGSADPAEKQAADQSKVYANTPGIQFLDVGGRPFFTMVDNGRDGQYVTRIFHDVQGRPYKMMDREGRVVSTYEYDFIGSCMHYANMDTGDAWKLVDVTGKPIRSWNSRGIQQITSYDELRRCVGSQVQYGDIPVIMAQTMAYGESQPDAEARNLRGRLYHTRDQAAVATTTAFDHMGNPISGEQRLVKEYKDAVDWATGVVVSLEDEIFTWSATFDHLGRELIRTRTDGSTISNSWNRRGLIGSVQAEGQAGSEAMRWVIKSATYNARGQPLNTIYGNGTESRAEYHHYTFAVASKRTLRAGTAIQDLRYTMDCMGKMVRAEDRTEQAAFFRGAVVQPTKEYGYDAIGRLVRATGREHLGQVGQNWVSVPSSASMGSRESSPSDGKAMARYTELYTYSSEGNILSLRHVVSDMSTPGWCRVYRYQEPSRLEHGKCNNRLSDTTVGNTISTCKYEGVAGQVGLMTAMSGFPVLRYDAYNQLSASSTQTVSDRATPETTFYRYDGHGRRVRKVVEGYAGRNDTPTKHKDHLYVDGAEVEILRKFSGAGSSPVTSSERWTWHLAFGSTRVAMIEAERSDSSVGGGAGTTFGSMVCSYAVSDHLSSVSLEVGEDGEVLSQEEYSPYGATTYNAASAARLTRADRRYRFAAKERDTETGLYYFENRYLATWLGRWLSPDPSGIDDGFNVFSYCGCDPVNNVDPTGLNEFAFVRISDKENREVTNAEGKKFYYPIIDPHTGERQVARSWDPLFFAAFIHMWYMLATRAGRFDAREGIGEGWRTDFIAKGSRKVSIASKLPEEWRENSVHTWSDPSERGGPHAELRAFFLPDGEKDVSEDIKILTGFVSMMPCQGEYRGEDCLSFFTKQGRSDSSRIVKRFVPLQQITPIFFVNLPRDGVSRSPDMHTAAQGNHLWEWLAGQWPQESLDAIIYNGTPISVEDYRLDGILPFGLKRIGETQYVYSSFYDQPNAAHSSVMIRKPVLF